MNFGVCPRTLYHGNCRCVPYCKAKGLEPRSRPSFSEEQSTLCTWRYICRFAVKYYPKYVSTLFGCINAAPSQPRLRIIIVPQGAKQRPPLIGQRDPWLSSCLFVPRKFGCSTSDCLRALLPEECSYGENHPHGRHMAGTWHTHGISPYMHHPLPHGNSFLSLTVSTALYLSCKEVGTPSLLKPPSTLKRRGIKRSALDGERGGAGQARTAGFENPPSL